jgi:tetratricopeptide (TPR) repeat protein
MDEINACFKIDNVVKILKRKKMNNQIRWQKGFMSLLLMCSFLIGINPVPAQDLVPISDITGGSSVFVFRSSRKAPPKKFITVVKPRRTKIQRVETAKRVVKQSVMMAKAAPRRIRTKTVEPTKVPPTINTMPKAEASKVFAGVGEFYMDKSETDKAIEFFRESVTLDEKNTNALNGLSEALATKGNQLLVQDNASIARAFFEEAVKLNPKNAVAYFGLAEVYSDSDKDAEALANYEKALQFDKDLTEIYVPVGILYYQKGEIAKADEYLSKALLASPNDSETQYFLGLVRYAQNRNEEALTAFRNAVKADANSAEGHFYIGEALARLNKNADAVVEYDEALRLKPKYFEASLSKGNVLYELEKYDEAAKAFDDARRLKNDNIAVYLNLGDTYRQAGKYNEAESNYNMATVFAQRDKNFDKEELGEIYSKIGFVVGRQCAVNMKRFVACKWNTGISSLEKAVEISPNAADYSNLGWAYYNSGSIDLAQKREAEGKAKLEKAKVALQNAISLKPAYSEAPYLNLGMTLTDLGDYQGAITALKAATDKKEDWTFAINELGIAYRKSGDFDNAAKQFQRAISKDDKFVAAYFNLAEAEFRRKNMKEVKKAHEKLKKLGRNDLAQQIELMTAGAVLK